MGMFFCYLDKIVNLVQNFQTNLLNKVTQSLKKTIMLNFRLKKFGITGLKILTLSLMLWAISPGAFAQLRQSRQVVSPDAQKAKLQAEKNQQKNFPNGAYFPSDSRGNSLGPAPTRSSISPNSTNGTSVINPNSRAFIYNGAGPFQLRRHALATPSTLTAIGSTVVFGFAGAMALNTDNQQMYVVDQAAPFSLYIVDTVTGNRLFVKNLTGVPQANFTGIAYDPIGKIMYGLSSSITVSQLLKINLGTGVCTPIGTASTLVKGGIQLNAAPGGSLFTVDIVTDALYKWNKSTGVPTLVGALGVDANYGQDGHFDMSDGQYYWAAIGAAFGPELRIIDTLTGLSTVVGPYPSQTATLGIYSKSTIACSGTPNPGNTITTDTAVCPSQTYALTLQNVTTGSGVSYQWQSAPSATGPWTNVGPNAPIYSITAPSSPLQTFYRAIVTCGGNSGTSTPVQVNANPPNNCYCTPNLTNCNLNDQIQQVIFGGINNTSACSPNGYGNYTTLTAGTAIAGGANPIQVKVGPGGTEYVVAWIDYNKNGIFEASEYTAIGSGNGTTISGAINIPANAQTGNTRMRIRVRYATNPGTGEACTTTGTYGEVEDYTVNITPCVPITFTTQPTNQSISCGSTATFTVATTGSLPIYQWQYRVDSNSVWQVVPNAVPYSGVNTNTLSIISADASLNKYQYRVLVTGACAAANPSNAATLTVTPLALAIAPTNITKCITDAPVLISAPSTQNILNFTNNTPGAVADGDLAGISRNVTVSGVVGPVQKVRVKINATSNYIGDLVISLKAPNGQIINLDYLLNKTNNGPSTGSGFVNTIFNLNRTVQNNTSTNVPASQAIDKFNAPYTGEFPIDNQQALYYVGVPSGPTGFEANTTNPASLTPTPASANGVWTLAMYDAGPPDPAMFQNFTLEITYGGAPATITLTPTTGLFTDSAGTVAYTGGAVTKVYANPTATTSYSAVTTSGTCSSNAQTIKVTVSQGATAVAAVVSKAICVGGVTSFISSVTGGANITRVWQVSTDGGATYTNLTDGGVYSGSGTDTLKVTGATTAMNGYKYRLVASAAPCAGTTTLMSTAGTITVNPTPIVVLSAAPYTSLYPGLKTTLTVSASPNAAATYKWYRNGILIPGVTGNNYSGLTVDNFGTYTVTVTDVNGCFGTSNAITLKDSANTRFFVYPSPNNGQFHVRYYDNSQSSPRALSVYDSKGARVFYKKYALVGAYVDMQVDLSLRGKGVYHIDLTDGFGNRLKTASVVVL